LFLNSTGGFKLKESLFPVQPATITGQAAIGADNPVAGHDDSHRIAADGLANRPGGIGAAYGLGYLAVGAGLSVGDVAELFPDLALEESSS